MTCNGRAGLLNVIGRPLKVEVSFDVLCDVCVLWSVHVIECVYVQVNIFFKAALRGANFAVYPGLLD